jgi:hypothetical protein
MQHSWALGTLADCWSPVIFIPPPALGTVRGVDKVIVLDEFCAQPDTCMSISIRDISSDPNVLYLICVLFHVSALLC